MTLVEILELLGVPHAMPGHEHVRTGYIGIDCPSCSPGIEHFRLGIRDNGKSAHCWACSKVNPITAVAEASGRPWREVLELFRLIDADAAIPEDFKPAGRLKLPDGIGPLLKVHRDYLRGRGFDPDELARVWKIGGIGLSSRYAWSVFIPVNHLGKTVSWTTRQTHDNGKRYDNAPSDSESYPAKRLLYGSDLCKHTAVVVEGPTDAWRIGPGAVAVFGLAYTEAQVLAISKYPQRVICLDNEPFAQEKARELANALAPFDGKTVTMFMDVKDPGSASPKKIAWIRKKFLGG
jgi:hypothetical protein